MNPIPLHGMLKGLRLKHIPLRTAVLKRFL